MKMMGGNVIELNSNSIGFGSRESDSDLIRVLSQYLDCLLIRNDDHKQIKTFAAFNHISIINGLSNYSHPCQILADILTVWEHRGSLDNLKITYVGDGNNIVHSWLQLATRLPMHFVCCSPDGYEPDAKTVNMLENSGISSFELSQEPRSAVKDTDVIYTDVWASMGQKEEAEAREKAFAGFQVNQELTKQTGKETFFMHCLPAERGREVTDEVMEANYSIVFDQAENRMHAQNAIMLYLNEVNNS